MAHVTIKKFDSHNLKQHRIWLVIGRRGSGKSFLLKDLLYNMREQFDFALAMCPTMESAEMLKGCLPESCVYNKFHAPKVDALVTLAQNYAAKKKDKNFLLVLDDVMYEKAICRTPSFQFLFYNGRHVRITCILLLQYLVDLPPNLRAQIDYVFCCREPIIANKMKLWKMFFGVFGTFEDFSTVLERCTQNYEVLSLDNTSQTTNPSECVRWYKAVDPGGGFRLCSAVFYTLTERLRRPADYSCPYNEDDASRRKGPLSLVVNKEGEDEDGSDVR